MPDRSRRENNFKLDFWVMNINENDFDILLQKTTPVTRRRLLIARNYIKEFYREMPFDIKNSDSIRVKTDYIFNWLSKNVPYDWSAVSNFRLKSDRFDAMDHVSTILHGKGVCAGRSTLFKILANNYFLKIPCYVVLGMAGDLNHELNEVILENGESVFYDLSNQSNKKATSFQDSSIEREH